MSGSTSRVTTLRNRYLDSPLIVDIEYIKAYRDAYEKYDGYHFLERRAYAHADAMESLKPIIREDELLVGSKTKHVRGAIAYCNYASSYILRELGNLQQEAQDSVTDVGSGGGIAIGKRLAATKSTQFVTFGKKFLLESNDVPILKEIATYFESRSMQGVGDRLWKGTFEEADYIEKGWNAVLYTAPHDPAPEGRFVLDFETALSMGYRGLINRMKTLIAETEIGDAQSAEKLYFWRSGVRVLEATIVWASKYAEAALELANETNDEDRANALRETAAICQHVPEHPPRNFREAIQSYWFTYLAGHIEGAHLGYSPGRLDKVLNAYYEKSLKSGEITRDEVVELLECLRIKMTELEYVASFSWEGLGSGNLFQNAILGGVDERGRRGDTELSSLIIQAAINCKTTQPTLSIWYDNTLSEEFLLKAAECIRTGVGFPAMFNFSVYAEHELEKGVVSLSTIRRYAAMGGCTEPTLEGMSYGVVQAGFINHGKLFELAMNGGKDPRTGIQFDVTDIPNSYDELLEAYKYHMSRAIQNWQRYWNYVMAAHRLTCNLIFCSCLTRDCIARGASLDDKGAIINHTPTTLSTGMVNVANSFAAVKSLQCDFEQLRAALASDWEGYSALHRRCVDAEKWGNNKDMVDDIYLDLFDYYCTSVSEQTNYLGEKYDPSMLAISTHGPFGKAWYASLHTYLHTYLHTHLHTYLHTHLHTYLHTHSGATPDGRKAGDTLADGVTSPAQGTDKNGPLAVLLSSMKVDHTRIRGGLLNMKFAPASLVGKRGLHALISLVRGYFESSGFQIQFNVVDAKTLKDAQAHPENYRDLIVRVAGFSAFFTELGKTIQDEVIARTEHELGTADSVEADIEDADIHQNCGRIFDEQHLSTQDGPGIRSTVFLKGCPLKCAWCSNPEGQKSGDQIMYIRNKCDPSVCGKACVAACPHDAISNDLVFNRDVCDACTGHECVDACPLSAIRLVGETVIPANIIDRTQCNLPFFRRSDGGLTLSGGEPLMQPEFVRDLVLSARADNIRVGVETCGQWSWKSVESILPLFSFFYYDVKCMSSEMHRKYTGSGNKTILNNLERLVDTVDPSIITISVPVIPELHDKTGEIELIVEFIASIGIKKMRLLPYHRFGVNKYEQLGLEYTMKSAQRVTSDMLNLMVRFAGERGVECVVGE